MGRDISQALFLTVTLSSLVLCFSSNRAGFFSPFNKKKPNRQWQLKFKIRSLKPDCIYIITAGMEDSSGFTETWSLGWWKLEGVKNKKDCFPCPAWANSRLPASQVIVLLPKDGASWRRIGPKTSPKQECKVKGQILPLSNSVTLLWQHRSGRMTSPGAGVAQTPIWHIPAQTWE